MNKQKLLYFRTFLITYILIIIIVILSLFLIKHSVSVNMSKTLQNIDSDLIGLYILEYKKNETQFPKDYKINQNLGILYELSYSFNEAEKEYKKAIKKAPFYVFEPEIKLAKLYILKSDYKQAYDIVNAIKDSPNKKLIMAKADFYFELSNMYLKNKSYQDAIDCAKKALYYRKKISSKKKDFVELLVKSKILYADSIAVEGDQKEAINYLMTSMNESPSALILYKLGLIYFENDQKKALEYFEKAFDYDPTIINYDLYEKLLTSLKNTAIEANSDIQIRLYQKKLDNIKKFRKYNILSKNDIDVTVLGSTKREYSFNIGQINTIIFNVTNMTLEPIENLYLYFQFYIEHDLIFSKKIEMTNTQSVLLPHQTTPSLIIKHKLFFKDASIRNANMKLKIFANKNEKLEPTYIGSMRVN